MKHFWIATAIAATAACALPTAADEAALAGLQPPLGAVPPPAVPYDPDAAYCTAEENRDDPSGRITIIAGLAMHVCRGLVSGPDGPPGPERLRVNHARIPGLTFKHFSGAMWLFGREKGRSFTREQWLEWEHREFPIFARHERFSGVLYEVWHDPDPKIYNRDLRPWAELFGPSPYAHGNLYLFVPEPGTAGLPWHLVRCHAEPLGAWRDEPGGCQVHIDYRGRNAFVKLFGAGPGYAQGTGYAQMHPLFPHHARDLHAVLSAVDATDDPERIACIEGGDDWHESRCETGM